MFSGLFPRFAELGNGFALTFLSFFGDSDLGLDLVFIVT